MRCALCAVEFTRKNSRVRFCSSKCRSVAWQEHGQADLARLEETLTRTLARVRGFRRLPKTAVTD
jgi:hypothetical protein